MGSVIYPDFHKQCYGRDWHRTHPEFVAEDDRLPWPESARLILEICAALWLVILLSVVW